MHACAAQIRASEHLLFTPSRHRLLLRRTERLLDWQPTGLNPLYHQDDLVDRPCAMGVLNSVVRVALYDLPSVYIISVYRRRTRIYTYNYMYIYHEISDALCVPARRGVKVNAQRSSPTIVHSSLTTVHSSLTIFVE